MEITKEYVDLAVPAIAFSSLLLSGFSLVLTIKNSITNTKLQASLLDRNNEKHWRREKIYDLANEIHEKCCDYWTKDFSSSLELLHFRIPAMIDDLECHATSVGIDINQELVELKDHATGRDFGSSTRTKLECNDYRLLVIQQDIQKIKKKI